MSQPFAWLCPFCNRIATITESNTSIDTHGFNCSNKDGDLALWTAIVVCPNPECRQYKIDAGLYKRSYNGARWILANIPIQEWQLRPKSQARPFPDYIPKAVRDDYTEACLIVNDSPKASSTLSRRCLQGIIRDFWGISKPRLVDEIKALEGRIDSTTWKAIDGVRSVGNIGAHMEKEINLIVDVDPEEAKTLIGLIEFLMKEWYVARHDREEHMQKVIDLAAKKDEEKKNSATAS
jgi:Domain of unknown function (DUF4145)